MGLIVTVLPGLDGDPGLLCGFVREQPGWADTDVKALPSAVASDYGDLADIVRPELHRSPDVLVAESFSGPLAILLARRLPQLRLLVLCNTFASRPRRILGLVPTARLATVTPSVRLVAAAMCGGDLELAGRVVDAIRKVPRPVLASRLRLVKGCDVRAKLAALGCRVLVIHGSRDRLVPRQCSAKISAVAHLARSVEIDAPHLILHTRPDASWAAISEHVERAGV